MRYSVLKICLFFSIVSLSAQSPYFDKYFNVGYNTYVTQNMIMLYDSTYLIQNIVKDSVTGRQDCGLLKVDRWGNEIKQRVINFQNVMYLWQDQVRNNLVQISPSSAFLFGVNYYNTNTVNNIFSKINTETLDTMLCKYYNDNFHYYSYNCVKLNGSKYLLAGTKSSSVGLSWPNVIEIDTSLNILNSYNITSFTDSITVTNAVLNLASKRLLLSGYKIVVSNDQSYNYARLLEVDTLGNINKTYFDNEGLGTYYTQVYYSSFDNSYIGIGSKTDYNWEGMPFRKMYISKFDANTLQPIWKNVYSTAQAYTNVLRDAVINEDGSIIACGQFAEHLQQFNTSNVNHNGVILKVNSSGNLVWVRQFDNFQNQPMQIYYEGFSGIEKTNDGGNIVCGMPYGKPQGAAWIIRVDSSGCFNTNCQPLNTAKIEGEKENMFNVYPNPASDKLYFRFQKGNNYGLIEIEVYDISGKLLIKDFVQEGKQNTLDIKNVQKGMYIIKAIENKKLLKISKIIIE